MKASKLVHKILKFINYANLCKFTEPRKGPGGAISFFLILFLLFFFFFFMSLPGRQIYIFLTLIFLFLVPSRGINFFFGTSRKLYHMKFAIFDVARCRMSATSLTSLFGLLFSFEQIYFPLVPGCHLTPDSVRSGERIPPRCSVFPG